MVTVRGGWSGVRKPWLGEIANVIYLSVAEGDTALADASLRYTLVVVWPSDKQEHNIAAVAQWYCWLVGWLVGWLVAWLVDWLVACLLNVPATC